MKKKTRKELNLETQTIRSLSTIDDRDLKQVLAAVYALSYACYTRPTGGCQ
ncbi:MAG TPA: hypothetical protein VL463_36130 [Kofleriaceae bacterium]|nr:hypothetical protein [Kofleriaceae bacterium]